jgi:hypothetical protein
MVENLYVGMLAVTVAGAATYPRGALQARLMLDKMKEEPTEARYVWAAAVLDVVMGLCVAYVVWAVLFTLLAGHPHPFSADLPEHTGRMVAP